MSQKNLRMVLTDGDRPIKILIERPLPDDGPMVLAIRTGDEAHDLLAQQSFDISRLDFELPGVGRIEEHRRRHDSGGLTDFLVIERDVAELPPAGFSYDEGSDVESENFLTRPMSTDQLQRWAEEALAGGNGDAGVPARRINAVRRGAAGQQPILGDSLAMCELLDIVERVSLGSASVLIRGETGTGKTLVARRVHDLSPRVEQRFVAINCSAFQDQLLESELFGHEKGSFTGAVAAKPGLFESADRGTLFLDEVGDMSASMQAKLLQVLDDGAFRRVGGDKLHRVDVRVISATNKDLDQEVKAGRFREDLLFRLNVIRLQMPPLRERQEDIPRLIEHFLDRFRLPGRPRNTVSPEATQLLMHYAWPGNVRELANAVEGLTLLAPGPEIRAEDLPPSLRPRTKLDLQDAGTPLPMKEIERLHIQRALRYTDGKKAPAARLLGIDVKTLSNKIKAYDIDTA